MRLGIHLGETGKYLRSRRLLRGFESFGVCNWYFSKEIYSQKLTSLGFLLSKTKPDNGRGLRRLENGLNDMHSMI